MTTVTADPVPRISRRRSDRSSSLLDPLSLQSIEKAFAVSESSLLGPRQQIDVVVNMLLLAVIGNNMPISADLRVSEKDAAHLLGYAAGSLKNLRQEGQAPRSYQRGVGGGRISYRLHDIAVWIEGRRDDT